MNTPILDARPVPVASARREAILQPGDVAAAVRFLVELHPRAMCPNSSSSRPSTIGPE
ncbi:MAG: hypothetical protein WKF75_20260 [Singulisphaera sp.]